MKNDKGFSLIELIIVIAIMGILLSFASAGIGLLTHQAARVASRDVYNMIGSAQTVAMSKGNSYYIISSDSDGNKSVFVSYKPNSNPEYITLQESSVNKNVGLSYIAGGMEYAIDGSTSQGIVIQIDRATGKFKQFYSYSGNPSAPFDPATDALASVCTDIKVVQGSRVYDIALVAATGKYYFK